MSKLIIALLAGVAFAYAVWLVVLRRPLPDPRGTTGLRRRFILATLLFGAMLGGCKKGPGNFPTVTCYDMAVATPRTQTDPNVIMTLRSVWLALDAKKSDEFNKKLEAAVTAGSLRQKTADILGVAYANLASHKDRTRGAGAMMLCYKMTSLGGQLYTSRETALKQLELIEKFRSSGRIDPNTAAKIHAVLAREFEMLYLAKDISGDSFDAQTKLIDAYKAGGPAPSASSNVAAAMAMEMEGAEAPDISADKQLEGTK